MGFSSIFFFGFFFFLFFLFSFCFFLVFSLDPPIYIDFVSRETESVYGEA